MADHISRRTTTFGLLAVAAATAGGHLAHADTYPPAGQTIRVIVPFVAGGTADITGRVVAERLAAMWKTPVVVENVPGAGANLGIERVAKGPSDGTMLLVVAPTLATNQFMYARLGYDPVKDIAPLSKVIDVPNLLVVKNALPVGSVAELMAYAKANPGKLNFASPGVGTSVHLAGELFKRMAGVDMVHVAYRGSSQALVDLVAGNVDVMFDNIPSSISLAREGKIRALGVTTAKRFSLAPEIPAIAETVPGFDVTVYFGIGVHGGTPQAIRDIIERDVRALSAEPAVKQRFASLVAEAVGSSTTEFTALYAAERERWGKLITELKIKAE